MKTVLFIVTLVFFISTLYSQNLKVDSLKLLLSKENIDTTRVRLLNEIGSAYGIENNELRLSYYQQAANLSHKVGYSKGEMRSLNLIAGNFGESIPPFRCKVYHLC